MSSANCVDFNSLDLRAVEIFEEQIGNYAERAVIEQLAADFEREELKPVVRPWEELEEEHITEENRGFATSYHARKKKIDAEAKKANRQPLGYSASDDVLKEELERYFRMTRSAITAVTEHKTKNEKGEEGIVRRQLYVERIHELQDALGRQRTDFTREAPRVEQPDYEKRLVDYRNIPAGERLRLVKDLQDRTFLGYILSDEQDAQIRAAAQARIFELARPE